MQPGPRASSPPTNRTPKTRRGAGVLRPHTRGTGLIHGASSRAKLASRRRGRSRAAPSVMAIAHQRCTDSRSRLAGQEPAQTSSPVSSSFNSTLKPSLVSLCEASEADDRLDPGVNKGQANAQAASMWLTHLTCTLGRLAETCDAGLIRRRIFAGKARNRDIFVRSSPGPTVCSFPLETVNITCHYYPCVPWSRQYWFSPVATSPIVPPPGLRAAWRLHPVRARAPAERCNIPPATRLASFPPLPQTGRV